MSDSRARAGEKAAFCASLDWDIPIEWFDLTGMHQFDNGHVARIELSDNPGQGCGLVGTYRSFDVTIVDPGSGAVASKVFPFDDYLDADERSDTRMAYDDGFRVVSHVGWKWYIAIPTTTRALCAAIERWIALFRGEAEHKVGEFYLDPRNPDSAYCPLDKRHELIVHKSDEGIVLDVWPDGGAESLWSTYFFDREMLPNEEDEEDEA